MPVRDDYLFSHVAGAATSVVVGAACKLINVNINTTGAGIIYVYNAATSATCSTTNLVGAIKASVVEGEYLVGGKKLSTGLVVVTTAAAQDITITYANA